MYFSAFPKIFYDFPNYSGDDTFLQVLTDITANVRVRKAVLEDITLYDEYDMMEGDTPEIVAERLYGNAQYHWIIMLANQRYDYLADFPLSSVELEEHIKDKYGADNIYAVHHYEKDGIIDEATATMKIPNSVIKSLKVNDFIAAHPTANARITAIDYNTHIANLRMDYGRFADGMIVTASGVRFDKSLNTNVFGSLLNFTIPTNGFAVNEAYTPITNYQYEVNENEKKRRIKIISPRLIEQILREYKELMF